MKTAAYLREKSEAARKVTPYERFSTLVWEDLNRAAEFGEFQCKLLVAPQNGKFIKALLSDLRNRDLEIVRMRTTVGFFVVEVSWAENQALQIVSKAQ